MRANHVFRNAKLMTMDPAAVPAYPATIPPQRSHIASTVMAISPACAGDLIITPTIRPRLELPGAIMAAVSTWVCRTIRAWSFAPTARRELPIGWSEWFGMTGRPARCVMTLQATIL